MRNHSKHATLGVTTRCIASSFGPVPVTLESIQDMSKEQVQSYRNRLDAQEDLKKRGYQLVNDFI